jgi:hypothetical protein
MPASDSQIGSRSGDRIRRAAEEPAADQPGMNRRRKQSAVAGARPAKTAEAVQPPEPTAGPSRRTMLTAILLAPVLFSLLAHVAGLLGMALMIVPREEVARPIPIVSSPADDTSFDEVETPEPEPEPVEITALEQLPVDVAVVDPGPVSIGDVASPTDAAVAALGDAGDVGDAEFSLADVGASFGSGGDGMGAAAGAATFFGKKAQGRRFVFVCDNSNSMGRGRFETALHELMKSVDGMSPKQSFYVIFFSDTSYRMFHPEAAPGFVPATSENKEKLRAWLQAAEMCLGTNGVSAMEAAFSLQSDVISILGDGEFGDQTEPMLAAPHSRTTIINTFGMDISAKGAAAFQAIAAANGGTYTPVTVSPEAAAMAKAKPINRNVVRGSVWGLTLGKTPPKPKKK